VASRSFKVGVDLPAAVRTCAVLADYGPRGISRWVSEALVEFVSTRGANLWDVGTGDNVDGFDRVFKVQLSEAAEGALDTAVAAIRRLTPNEEGVRSAVFRSAVRWKIAHAQSHQKYSTQLRVEKARSRKRRAG
jgi:hypothetical protein